MNILMDLRSIDYGCSGGIENYTYYLIDSIKNKDVKIILDVAVTSRKKYKIKYRNEKNIKVISDPLQWITIYSTSKNKLIKTISNLIGKTIFKIFNIEFTRRRTQWANSIEADLAYYPFHLDNLQHNKIPVVTTIHALLPDYSEKEFRAIESHILKAKELITSWNYPYQELIKKYPSRKGSWHLIHYVAMHNIDINKQVPVDEVDHQFYLYVSFFIERKNHLKLIEAYNISKLENNNLPKLVLVGDGDPAYKQIVKDLITKLKLDDSVIVFNYLSDEKVSYLYHNCKAVIAPTIWEAASGTALEATYCGKPVLCSDVPPLRDFADYFNLKMMFFNPDDATDIAKVILQFENDNENLKNDALENATIIQNFNIHYFGEKIMQVFNNSIHSK